MKVTNRVKRDIPYQNELKKDDVHIFDSAIVILPLILTHGTLSLSPLIVMMTLSALWSCRSLPSIDENRGFHQTSNVHTLPTESHPLFQKHSSLAEHIFACLVL